MTVVATSFLQDKNFIDVCYIVAFSLFIYGLMQLRGPRTAVRGNATAAVEGGGGQLPGSSGFGHAPTLRIGRGS